MANRTLDDARGQPSPPEVIEQAKQQIDYVKHVTTLSTGSILLLATMLDKVFGSALHWRPLIAATFAAFMLAVAAAVFFQSAAVVEPRFFSTASMPAGTRRRLALLFALMWISFMAGVAMFSIFAIKNLA